MDIFLWAIKINRILYNKMQLLPTLFRVAENMTEKTYYQPNGSLYA